MTILSRHSSNDAIVNSLEDSRFQWNNSARINNFTYVVKFGLIYRTDLSKNGKLRVVHNGGIQCKAIDAVVTDGEYLFIFGDNGTKNSRFCPVAKKCISLPRIRIARFNFAYALVKDSFYIIGGRSRNTNCYLGSVEVFDTRICKWREAPSLPLPLFGAAATSLDNRWIIVTGGYSNNNELTAQPFLLELTTQSFVLEDGMQEWTPKNFGFVPARAYHHLRIIGRSLFALGGIRKIRLGNQYDNSIEYLDRQQLISNWDIIQHFVLLRQLVEDGRAFPVQKMPTIYCDKRTELGNILEMLIVDFDLDIFREVLSFFF